jgi:hypothetical protein
MDHSPYDRASKWLIQHHGDALLRLAGVTDITSWRPLQAEIVQPRQLPDGLLEVRRAGQAEPDLFILEVSTYPDRRVPEQLLGDAALVYLDRGVLPEVLALVLHPKGNVRVDGQIDLRSPGGWTRWQASWHVVELWTLPAADLLATGDPGLAPWALLAHWDGPPEVLFRQGRAVVDEQARPEERPVLLTVMQVLASLRYDNEGLFAILGGKQVVIESNYIGRIIAEQVALKTHRIILNLIRDQLGDVPSDIEAAVRTIQDDERLDRVTLLAARAADYEEFRRGLSALLAQPPAGA